MIILFSPSESKTKLDEFGSICSDSFIFNKLYEKRMEAVNIYNNYINSHKADELLDIFGIKDIEEIKQYQNDIFKSATCTAIKRYSGVSYTYLAFNSLNEDAQKYILDNVIIFSNLFGPVSANDKLPFYKLKQGAKIENFAFETYYKKVFSNSLDEYINSQDVVDLRAGFYEKFYKINKPYLTFKFIKNGKVVSHFAKAYRGILLKTMAENNIIRSCDILSCLPAALEIIDKNKQGLKEEIVLNVLD